MSRQSEELKLKSKDYTERTANTRPVRLLMNMANSLKIGISPILNKMPSE